MDHATELVEPDSAGKRPRDNGLGELGELLAPSSPAFSEDEHTTKRIRRDSLPLGLRSPTQTSQSPPPTDRPASLGEGDSDWEGAERGAIGDDDDDDEVENAVGVSDGDGDDDGDEGDEGDEGEDEGDGDDEDEDPDGREEYEAEGDGRVPAAASAAPANAAAAPAAAHVVEIISDDDDDDDDEDNDVIQLPPFRSSAPRSMQPPAATSPPSVSLVSPRLGPAPAPAGMPMPRSPVPIHDLIDLTGDDNDPPYFNSASPLVGHLPHPPQAQPRLPAPVPPRAARPRPPHELGVPVVDLTRDDDGVDMRQMFDSPLHRPVLPPPSSIPSWPVSYSGMGGRLGAATGAPAFRPSASTAGPRTQQQQQQQQPQQQQPQQQQPQQQQQQQYLPLGRTAFSGPSFPGPPSQPPAAYAHLYGGISGASPYAGTQSAMPRSRVSANLQVYGSFLSRVTGMVGMPEVVPAEELTYRLGARESVQSQSIISVYTPRNELLGRLETDHTRYLAPVMQRPWGVQFRMVVENRSDVVTRRPGEHGSDVAICVTVYGPSDHRNEVVAFLKSMDRLFYVGQELPDTVAKYFTLPPAARPIGYGSYAGLGYGGYDMAPTVEEIESDMERLILGTIDMETIPMAEPSFMSTELRPFQKQGLWWMIQREINPARITKLVEQTEKAKAAQQTNGKGEGTKAAARAVTAVSASTPAGGAADTSSAAAAAAVTAAAAAAAASTTTGAAAAAVVPAPIKRVVSLYEDEEDDEEGDDRGGGGGKQGSATARAGALSGAAAGAGSRAQVVDDGNYDDDKYLPPFWVSLKGADGTVTYANKITKETSPTRPEHARGGILADEMGLGKTIQVIALILSNSGKRALTGSEATAAAAAESRATAKRQATIKESFRSASRGGARKKKGSARKQKRANSEDKKNGRKAGARKSKGAAGKPKKTGGRKGSSGTAAGKGGAGAAGGDSAGARGSSAAVRPRRAVKTTRILGSGADDDDDGDDALVSLASSEPDLGSNASSEFRLDSDSDFESEDDDDSSSSASDGNSAGSRVLVNLVSSDDEFGGDDNNEGDDDDDDDDDAESGDDDDYDDDDGTMAGPGAAAKRSKKGGYSIVDDDDDDDDASSWYSDPDLTSRPSAHCTRASGPTLIVVPVSVITNWQDQLHLHSRPGALHVYTYHGANRSRDVEHVRKHDVVITTYSILRSDFSQTPQAREQKLEAAKEKYERQMESYRTAIQIGRLDATMPEPPKEPRRRDSGRPSPLFQIQWLRIVLDEAHVIREDANLVSTASSYLNAHRRWCLTGTPLQNKVNDVFALMRFMRVAPFGDKKYWTKLITRPMRERQKEGLERLRNLMAAVTLRRRKSDKLDGKPILSIPPKNSRVRSVVLSPPEQTLYDLLAQTAEKKFRKLMHDQAILANYAFVLEMLLRMRQACGHMELVPHRYFQHGFDSIDDGKVGNLRRLLDLLEDQSAEECSICLTALNDPVITPCGHVFCRECLEQSVEHSRHGHHHHGHGQGHGHSHGHSHGHGGQGAVGAPGAAAGGASYGGGSTAPGTSGGPTCPLCRQPVPEGSIVSREDRKSLKISDLRDSLNGKQVSSESLGALTAEMAAADPMSSKISALCEELENARALDPTCKVVIFSQWTSMLDKIQRLFEKRRMGQRRLDGSMTSAARQKALRDFADDPDVWVFLVSLSAGGVGLNLTSANRVYLMDPWWNPAAEDQAVDRVHRMGQEKPVEVVRFVVRGSVEERVIALQEKKRELIKTVMAGVGGKKKSREEMQRERLSDLKYLFNLPAGNAARGGIGTAPNPNAAAVRISGSSAFAKPAGARPPGSLP